MKKESKEKIFCAVMLAVIVIGSGWFGGLIDDKFDEERMQTEEKMQSISVVAANTTTTETGTGTELKTPIEIQKNETIQIETNKTINASINQTERKNEFEDINLAITQLYYDIQDKSYLHLQAQTNLGEGEIIEMDVFEITDEREVIRAPLKMFTANDGMIFMAQPLKLRRDYRYKAVFKHNGVIVAHASSIPITPIPVTGDWAIFFPVIYKKDVNVSKFKIITKEEKYCNGLFAMNGTTNIPCGKTITLRLEKIIQKPSDLGERIRYMGTYRIKPTIYGEIRIGKEWQNSVHMNIVEGYYRITFIYNSEIITVIGFHVIRIEKDDKPAFKGINWAENTFIPVPTARNN